MLTYSQLKWNFHYYNICFKLCLLPLQLDHLTFSPTKGLRYFWWKIQFLVSSGYGVFMAIPLLQILIVNPSSMNIIYISIHSALSLMGILVCLYYTLLVTNTEDHILVCNELLRQMNCYSVSSISDCDD